MTNLNSRSSTPIWAAKQLFCALALAGLGQAPAYAQSSPEILYVATCVNIGAHEHEARIGWYADWTRSQHGELPDASALTHAQVRGASLLFEATFGDGNRVSAVVKPSRNYQELVGQAFNSFRGFDCFVDNQRAVWTENGFDCTSDYYCTAR